jgi:hypothetical protein
MPNYLEYHKSLTDELHALKDRIRNLAEHWPTDGEYKEAALRTVLRRHLPSSLVVGRGFIVTEQSSSTQIDLLIADGSKPTLFRDGDLMFVTPDCVRAVMEVKTSLPASADVEECAVKLAKIGKLCQEHGEAVPWLGIFSYEGTLQQAALLLNAVEAAYQQTGAVIDCLAYGKDRFVRFWKKGEIERGDAPEAANVEKWRAYLLEHLASAYFVGNVVDALSTLSRKNNAFAWYPLSDGKRVHMQDERKLNRR